MSSTLLSFLAKTQTPKPGRTSQNVLRNRPEIVRSARRGIRRKRTLNTLTLWGLQVMICSGVHRQWKRSSSLK
ncbi:hypothetical protein I7I50_09304 [Histoplasma capsulatum G186AR]|uniref:Uncharacterized protein n=1 Tax=Ajellomyces capsulatus TaxID=5037 RepID=A0A8H8D1B6_AJECA|nr:hypothetical protein I7I52_06825 [Histoplasma capsulatum]QSS74220.1 hypothetical protein I7I50_09304 [Histoplasma capsulatum G186AR]